MNKRTWLALTLVLVLIVVTACEGGTRGSVMGARQRCTHKVDSGKCTGSWRKLSGTYSVDVENDRLFGKTPVQVRVQASVESGRIRFWVKSPDSEITGAKAAPGKSGTLEGVATGSGDKFEVMFEAVEGPAQGISYEITYRIP